MIEQASILILFFVFAVLTAKRLMTYLHVLQQEDYSSGRLFKWMFTNGVYDKRLSFVLAILSIGAYYVPQIPDFVTAFCVFVAAAFIIFLEKDPRKSSKKKLVATARAKRIFFPSLILMILISSWVFVVGGAYNLMVWPWIVAVQLVPFVLMFVNLALSPFEFFIQKQYWTEAHAKLNALNPTIIGITGSFGKTSVKHILGHILSSKYDVLMTPGSVNTAMGITRIVREQLQPTHKYFIAEMGAYGVGSIKALCDLAAPDFGILTSIGHAHYERFKSLDTVARAKSELSEAVLAKGNQGKMIIHERTLKFPYVQDLRRENSGRFVACGDMPSANVQSQKEKNYLLPEDVQIVDVSQSLAGLDITFVYGDKSYDLRKVPIFGLHHGHNTVLAIVTALELGMDFEEIKASLRTLPQISHRLEVKPPSDGGYAIIDDSYNSNPLGFRSALDLLDLFGKKFSRKILLTPGMIELGNAHDDAHAQIGAYAANVCDVVIVVCPDRIPSFVKSVKEGNKQLVSVQTFAEALDWLNANKAEGDIVLIENDLPDMYERVPKM